MVGFFMDTVWVLGPHGQATSTWQTSLVDRINETLKMTSSDDVFNYSFTHDSLHMISI